MRFVIWNQACVTCSLLSSTSTLSVANTPGKPGELETACHVSLATLSSVTCFQACCAALVLVRSFRVMGAWKVFQSPSTQLSLCQLNSTPGQRGTSFQITTNSKSTCLQTRHFPFHYSLTCVKTRRQGVPVRYRPDKHNPYDWH